jgi:hypothetical protein
VRIWLFIWEVLGIFTASMSYLPPFFIVNIYNQQFQETVIIPCFYPLC